jgi:tripartite-type tricarboxylate transporter receptor subunit TctC
MTKLKGNKMFKQVVTAVVLMVSTMAMANPKQITTTIGFTPGSGNELSFRGVAAIVEKNNPGVSFVVVNRPGAGEVVALNQFTALDPKKGDNIYIASHQGVFTAIENWYPEQMKFKPMDLEFVTTIAKSPLAVVANVNSPTNTPQQLLNRIKNGGDVNFGLGAAAHRLLFEYLMTATNASPDRVKHIMYQGPGNLAQDVAGGHVEFGILPTAVAYPLVKAGKLKYIALAGEQRLAQIPEVPLWQDHVKGMNIYAAWALVLPPGSTREQVEYYRALFVPAIRSAEAKRFFDDNLMFTVPAEQSPEGLRKYITELRKTWLPISKKITP